MTLTVSPQADVCARNGYMTNSNVVPALSPNLHILHFMVSAAYSFHFRL